MPAGLMALHAQIVLGEGQAPPPAAYAVVEVLRPQNGGSVPHGLVAHAYGMTDETGRLTLPMPYPRVPEPPNNEPYPRLGEQTFALTVRVYSEPVALQPLPGSALPDLASILG